VADIVEYEGEEDIYLDEADSESKENARESCGDADHWISLGYKPHR
jgi:hypothetical protein